MMLERGAVIDPSFQFYDIDPKTRARRTVTERGEMLRRLREVSPVDHVSAGDPPTLLTYGDRDSAGAAAAIAAIR